MVIGWILHLEVLLLYRVRRLYLYRRSNIVASPRKICRGRKSIWGLNLYFFVKIICKPITVHKVRLGLISLLCKLFWSLMVSKLVHQIPGGRRVCSSIVSPQNFNWTVVTRITSIVKGILITAWIAIILGWLRVIETRLGHSNSVSPLKPYISGTRSLLLLVLRFSSLVLSRGWSLSHLESLG